MDLTPCEYTIVSSYLFSAEDDINKTYPTIALY